MRAEMVLGLSSAPAAALANWRRVQSAFERDALQIDIVCESGLLHEAADEVVSDKMHAEFAFDHVRGFAAQDVHVEVDFNLAKMEFDAPAAEVEIGEVCGGEGGIEQGGDESDALRTKALVGHGVADGAHGDAFGQEVKFIRSHAWWPLSRTFPSDGDIEVRVFGKLGTNGHADLLFRQPHEGIDSAGGQASDGSEGAKPAVGENQIAWTKGSPKLLKKFGFVGLTVTVRSLEQRPRVQAENADKVHGGKAAAGLLALALRPAYKRRGQAWFIDFSIRF